MNDDYRSIFGASIDAALAKSDMRAAAIAHLHELTSGLAGAIESRTDGAVTAGVFYTKNPNLARLHKMARAASRLLSADDGLAIGEDREDSENSFAVVAYRPGDQANQKVLWTLELNDAGYPITVVGPALEQQVTCFAESDLLDYFKESASTALVGRKVLALRDEAVSAASALATQPGADEQDS